MAPQVKTAALLRADTNHQSQSEAKAERKLPRGALASYSWSQVRALAEQRSYVVVIDGTVYDLERWAPHHPGGKLTLENVNGRDATDAFYHFHLDKKIHARLKSFAIGTVSDYKLSELEKRQRAFREEIAQSDFFDLSPWFYARLVVMLACIFTAALWAALHIQTVWGAFFAALLMALFWQQVAFLGHDCGHGGVTGDFFLDRVIGVFAGNILTGISLTWWKKSHNVHHIVPNSIEHDPDIQHLPFMALSVEFSKSLHSTFHDKKMAFDGVARFFVSHQQFFFAIIMMCARYNLYVQSLLTVLFDKNVPRRKQEITLLVLFWVWYGALLWHMPSFWIAFVYHVTAHAAAGILNLQITLSHMAMDLYKGTPYNDSSDSWIPLQIANTMNISCPWWMDWFHGGLHFQIEHHIFPRVPRHNLRRLKPVVEKFAAENGIEYLSAPFFEAVGKVFERLRNTAEQIQQHGDIQPSTATKSD